MKMVYFVRHGESEGNAGLYVTEKSIEVVGPADVKIFEEEDIKTLNPGDLV
ncbi:MAG: hypothetical protein AAB837_00440 [Patescibacteria group bacterium]